MSDIFYNGGILGSSPQNRIDLEYNLSLTQEYSPGIVPVFSALQRGRNAVFACDVVFPLVPADSVLFETGGTGVGIFVGIVSSGTIFRARAGEGDAAIDITSDDGVVLDTTDFPKDGLIHRVVFEVRIKPGRIRLWIDGIFKGEANTTTGLPLESSVWSGGDNGGYLQPDAENAIAGGDATAPWAGGTAQASTLRYYENQLAMSTSSIPSGIFNLAASYEKIDFLRKQLLSNIVSQGLILLLDPGDSNSYPGYGSTLFDLSGNNNHLTLFNSPSFLSSSGGVISFNGIDQYAQNSLNLSVSDLSIVVAARYSGSIRGRTVTSVSNNWLIGHHSAQADKYYAEGWITSATGGPNDTNWRIFSATESYSADQRSFYSNNSVIASNSTAGANGFNGLSLGRSGLYSEYSTCEIGVVLVYNRVLSEAELTQNFNAIRGRYGL